jgi:hypothetical protein
MKATVILIWSRLKRVKEYINPILLIIMLGVGSIVIVLNLWPVASTAVEIELVVNRLSFTIGQNLEIHGLASKRISISHLDNLELTPLELEEASNYDINTDLPNQWQRLEVDGPLQINRSRDDWRFSITSAYLRTRLGLDAGSTVTIENHEHTRNQLTIHVKDGGVTGAVNTADTFILNCIDGKIGAGLKKTVESFKDLRIATDEEIQFRDLNGSIGLVLEFPAQLPKSKFYLLEKAIKIEALNLTRLVGGKSESTIIADGTIYLWELDGKQIKIRTDDFLAVDGFKDFQIKRLSFDNQLKVSLVGEVSVLKSGGSQEFLYSRLPSRLEYCRTNPSWRRVSVTLVMVITGIVAIFRFFKIV